MCLLNPKKNILWRPGWNRTTVLNKNLPTGLPVHDIWTLCTACTAWAKSSFILFMSRLHVQLAEARALTPRSASQLTRPTCQRDAANAARTSHTQTQTLHGARADPTLAQRGEWKGTWGKESWGPSADPFHALPLIRPLIFVHLAHARARFSQRVHVHASGSASLVPSPRGYTKLARDRALFGIRVCIKSCTVTCSMQHAHTQFPPSSPLYA